MEPRYGQLELDLRLYLTWRELPGTAAPAAVAAELTP